MLTLTLTHTHTYTGSLTLRSSFLLEVCVNITSGAIFQTDRAYVRPAGFRPEALALRRTSRPAGTWGLGTRHPRASSVVGGGVRHLEFSKTQVTDLPGANEV